MTEDLMGYDQIVEDALKGVVREALSRVAVVGLPGDHHFYITYKTDAPGVHVPQSLQKQYPEEITIVIQHRFWDLIIDDDKFSVTLSFGGRKEYLEVPFAAITGFADPSVQFGLQFKAEQSHINENLQEQEDNLPMVMPSDELEDTSVSIDTSTVSADVVVLDRFRKK